MRQRYVGGRFQPLLLKKTTSDMVIRAAFRQYAHLEFGLRFFHPRFGKAEGPVRQRGAPSKVTGAV